MSNQENNQKQIQFPAQQELKHLRTRCGKVYALGNNRFRAVVQTTPVHEYDAATHQWVELSAEKRQQMAAQAHSPIATFADSANSAENAAGILDTYVKEGSTQNFSHDERLWISNTNYYGNRLTYLKVVLILLPYIFPYLLICIIPISHNLGTEPHRPTTQRISSFPTRLGRQTRLSKTAATIPCISLLTSFFRSVPRRTQILSKLFFP